MPPRDFKLRFEDILEAVEKIERYTKGITFDEFRSDDKTVDAGHLRRLTGEYDGTSRT